MASFRRGYQDDVRASRTGTGGAGAAPSFFEQQRAHLLDDIAMSFEQVLANINKLNRSLEAVVTVGNEFSSVEALWSQFEGVMGRGAAGEDATAAAEQQQQQQQQQKKEEDDGDDDDQPQPQQKETDGPPQDDGKGKEYGG